MKHPFSMTRKTVVLTGGSGGLGTAVTEGLLAVGAFVAIADLVEPSRQDENILFVRCDLSDTDSIRTMFETVRDRRGRIDVLINCATYGAGYGPSGSLDRLTDADWRSGLDGAIGTAFRCTREVIPYMERQGGGCIVNFSSIHGVTAVDPNLFGDSGLNNPANYGVGKAGTIQFTRYSAVNLAKKNIRVNCVTPGTFPNAAERQNAELIGQLSRQTILGRVGEPEEIVGAVLLLASDASNYMTGANIVVDGGWTAW